ncbi:LLM class flavin-dependent oxidoreductase [Actinoplanes philippinensis]|uniref:LLM class flavin-dependent oxidoreductase n=1 Tax=Actinoplanes philippinensis TaxID=35752 RepID=UPI0033D7FBDB
MSTYSILMPFAPTRPEQALPFGAFAQWSSAHRLWQGQATLHEPHHTFTHMAAGGFRVPVGLGVTLMPFRHPYDAALQAQSLAVTMGHPVVAGFGPGAKVLQEGLLGAPYRSQLQAVREYVTIVRGLLDGEPAPPPGEYFTCKARLPKVPRPPVEVGLGVLRPGMARVAGETADVAITWLTPASYLRDTLIPALREGAEAAGRPVPRVVSIVPIALDRDGSDPRDAVLTANSGHLSLPHYRDMLSRSGIHVDTADPRTAAEQVLKGGAFLAGTPGQVAGRLREFTEAGVDEVVLNTTATYARFGVKSALEELEKVLREVSS